MARRQIIVFVVVAAFLAAFPGCSKRQSHERESVAWEDVVKGLKEPAGSPGYAVAMLSLARTWKQHGKDGATLMTSEGLELIGLAANGAVHGATVMLDMAVPPGQQDLLGALVAGMTVPAEQASDEWFRMVVYLTGAMKKDSSKSLQNLVETADAGNHELSESIRLCLARQLTDALVAAGSTLSTERGRVILEKLPGWPSPPTRDILETLFPANLSRISRWVNEGRKLGGLHETAWDNVAARLEKGLAHRLYDLPVVVEAEARRGTPPSAVGSSYSPLEVVHVMKDGVTVSLRPVLQWDKSFMAVASGSSTWTGKLPEDKSADVSTTTLVERLAALHETAARLEKGVYPTLVGTAMGDRIGKSVLIAVDHDATSSTLVETINVLASAGYVDFRVLTPGPPGMANPVMSSASTGTLSTARTVRVFFTDKGASIFGNPAASLPSDNLPPGVETVGRNNSGYFVAWDPDGGFSSALAQAFSTMGAQGAGHVDIAEFVTVSTAVPAAMLVDAVAELQAAPGVQFAKIEPNFPGLICPQGRSCPGVVPVFGARATVPAGIR